MSFGPLIAPEAALDLLDRAVLLDARAGPDAREAFETARVRGAVYADLESDLSAVGDPASGGRHPLPTLDSWCGQLGRWGIDPRRPVLVYDDAGGGMAAARAWWMLRAVGHQQVAVIDGGWAALRRLSVPTESGSMPSTREPKRAYPTEVSRWPSVGMGEVEALRRSTDARLLDARAPARFEGTVEPIDPVPGHIPGAVNLHWESQLRADGRWLETERLRARYDEVLGNVPPERVVCYCGSGVTACHLLLAMEACGLPGAKLYVGSWSEWCRVREDARAST